MKHSAKAAARLARQRARLDRRLAGSIRPGSRGMPVSPASSDLPGQAGTPGTSLASVRLTQLPYALVLAGVAAGLVLMQVASDAVRGGTFVIAGALLAGSVARLVLPESRAGMLGSRRRLLDVAVFGALGVGLLVAGLVVQVPG
jgi:Protein of unknown function (DUF3017)